MEENKVKCAIDALLDKKAFDVKSLKVGPVTTITDYFVLATGSNKSQMDAMIDGVQEEMKEAGYELMTREGQSQGGWVLLDYGDVVVHIFDSEMREFYNLDQTWRDAESHDFK